MTLAGPRLIRFVLGVAVVLASVGSQPVAADTTPSGVDSFETPSSVGSDGQVTNRSHSGAGDSAPVGAISQPKNVTTSSPGLVTSFDGLNHFDQRFGSTSHGNQFSLEPPDQGLCVGTDVSGNVRVMEVVNDVRQVFDASGNALTAPEALNHFFGYAPAIVRGAGPHGGPLFGPFVTDPSCLFDAPSGRWFVDVLTLDTFQTVGPDGRQHFTGVNHLDLAVSNTSDPTGAWTLYTMDVTDDGTNGVDHHCLTGNIGLPPGPGTHLHACIGDYPHIGSNADGIFLTTNEYSLFGPEFHGAQVYAMSKSALEAGSGGTLHADGTGAIFVQQTNTQGMDT
ncbi:MAG TPA: hypothetical protein VF942_09930, partial [Acidimicrobiales bacterium]